MRASIISTLSIVSGYYGRTFKPIVLLLLAAAATGWASPHYVWGNVSWYLSFLAFFGVLVVAPMVTKRLLGDKKPKLVMQIVIESLCAECLTLPYLLHVFGQMSLVALPANMLVAAFVPLAMLISMIAGVSGALVPAIAGWLAWPARWLLGYMLNVAELLSCVPHSFVEHIRFSFGAMAASYGMLAAALWLMYRRSGKYAIITDKKQQQVREGTGNERTFQVVDN